MSDFFKLIEACIAKKQIRSNLVNQFLSNRTDIKRFIIGKNEESNKLINFIKIDGIIDDFSETKVKWNGIPVFRIVDVPKDALIVNCSSSISPVTVGKKLAEAGLRNILNIHEVIAGSEGKIKKPWFVDQMRDDYMNHKSQWSDLYNLMADEESRKTLLDVMRFRLTADPAYMKEYNVRLKQQYFEDFMKYDNEVFADIGGFDGDTTEEFCNHYPNYKKVLFFEPSPKNMVVAKKRLKDLKNIEYFPFGLADEAKYLAFNSQAGSASSISETGDCRIEVRTFDEVIKEQVDTIKMDIEGMEYNALVGSKNQIQFNSPKLCIAVYHRASDFRQIYKYILGINPNYYIYLRHYTEGWSETVMYFVPK